MEKMEQKKNICVFCGSSMGNDPLYAKTAEETGRMIGRNGYNLIYGGACCGTMGVLAQAALDEGAHVHGVIPDFFKNYDFEVIHTGLPRLTRVATMMERKEILIREADAFVSLPGSYGTLDELFETLVLLQLKQIEKPSFLLNIEGFYDPLLQQFDKMEATGFLQARNRRLLGVVPSVEALSTELSRL